MLGLRCKIRALSPLHQKRRSQMVGRQGIVLCISFRCLDVQSTPGHPNKQRCHRLALPGDYEKQRDHIHSHRPYPRR